MRVTSVTVPRSTVSRSMQLQMACSIDVTLKLVPVVKCGETSKKERSGYLLLPWLDIMLACNVIL